MKENLIKTSLFFATLILALASCISLVFGLLAVIVFCAEAIGVRSFNENALVGVLFLPASVLLGALYLAVLHYNDRREDRHYRMQEHSRWKS